MNTPKTRTKGSQFIKYFGPVLEALRKLGGSGSPGEVADEVAELLKIPAKAREELIPSGTSRFLSQVQWARYYLSKDGFISSSERGVWSLTDKGRNAALAHNDAMEVFSRVLNKYREERRPANSPKKEAEEGSPESVAPETFVSHREHLLNVIKSLPPSGFERLCQRLLREAGFTQVTVTGGKNDEGIDGIGILQINPFVSFQVRFQCKRYSRSVSPSQVRDFRGAMEGRADKGIILTTGTFTAEARREALRDGACPIELVDGQKLIEMFEHLQLGLKPTKAFEVDADFFDDFRDEFKSTEKNTNK
jgi:restriction system protein